MSGGKKQPIPLKDLQKVQIAIAQYHFTRKSGSVEAKYKELRGGSGG